MGSIVADDQVPRHQIRLVAEWTGIAEETLRVWEQRYKWPKPGRGDNDYRLYSDHQVKALRAVAKLLESGMRIGDILANEQFGLLTGHIPDLRPKGRRPVRLEIDFSGIPLPATALARQVRQSLEEALRDQKKAEIDRLSMEGARLHPNERSLAITLPIQAFNDACCGSVK